MKVGDYVRTKKGIITKIEKCKNGTSDKLTTKETGIILDLENWFKDDCVKSSPNIIDLIEVGDYVNGKQVYESRYHELYISYVYCGGIGVRTTECYATFINDMKEEDIESVVTKEQFESMEYKVKE